MATKGEPYRSVHKIELDRIEQRRVAANVTIDDLCDKASVPLATYRRMRKSGLAFRRQVKALAMAMRTLEADRKREDDIFPFGSPSPSAHISGSASAPRDGRAGS